MRSRLSAWKYVRNNKRQVWVMIIALSLTFMTMYLINFMLLTTEESFKGVFFEMPKKLAVMNFDWKTLGVDPEAPGTDEEKAEAMRTARQKLIDDLKAREGIEEVYYTQTLSFRYAGLIGEIWADFPLLSREQIPAYLDHMGAKLIEGRLPEGDGEILVESTIMKNQNMELNGYFLESAWGKNFRVVGVLESDNFTCVGTPQGYANTGWYYVVLCEPEHAEMLPELEAIGIHPGEYDRIYDVKDWAKMYKEEITDVMDGALLGILLVVTVFLAISILVAYVSFLRNRTNEYCLYTSIGFSRLDVYSMIMREIGIIFGISLLLGAVFSGIAMVIMGECMMKPLGLICKFIYPEHLLRILAAFVAIVALLQLPILTTIHRIKTIDMMEE